MAETVVLPIPTDWVAALIEARYELESPVSVQAAGLDSDLRYVLVVFSIETRDLNKLDIDGGSVFCAGDECGVN